MNKTTEALMLAEEALGELRYQLGDTVTDNAITKYFKALAAICEALAEPDIEEMTLTQIASRHEPVQEPVAWMWKMHGWVVTAHGKHQAIKRYVDICKPPLETQQSDDFIELIQLYAAPVSVEAIRSEALEEAAKVCEAKQSYNAMHANTDFAAAIRGLK